MSMASTISPVARRSEVQTLDLPLIGAVPGGPAKVQSPDADWILPLVAQAIDRTLPRKEAAFLMGLDASLMTRQLQGDGHLSVRRLGALPEAFWVSLADELRAHFGMLDRAQILEQAESLMDRARQLFAKAAAR
jgi:hypothetical protein